MTRTRPRKRAAETRRGSGGASDEALGDLLERGYRYALALTHDPDGAADVLQDACVATLSAAGPWSAGYLCAAIRTRFIDQYRRRRLVVLEPYAEPGDPGDPPSADLRPEASPGDEDRIRAELVSVERALGMLRPEEREVLYLTAVEGHTAQEIAELTSRPRGTVLSLIHRGRRKLREILGEPVAVLR